MKATGITARNAPKSASKTAQNGAKWSRPNDPRPSWCLCGRCGDLVDADNNDGGDGMKQTLRWRSLHEWRPKEGTWALLWPGYYGPFTACWMRGRWTICEDADFRHATVGAPITLPHLATDAIPEWDRLNLSDDDGMGVTG